MVNSRATATLSLAKRRWSQNANRPTISLSAFEVSARYANSFSSNSLPKCLSAPETRLIQFAHGTLEPSSLAAETERDSPPL